MPQGSDEVIFIALILGVAIFILLVLLAGVVLIHHYEHRRNDKVTLNAIVGTITDFFPKARSKEESPLSPPDVAVVQSILEDKATILPSLASEVDIPPPKDGIKNMPETDHSAISWLGVPVTAFAMLALILAPLVFYIQTKDSHFLDLGDWYIVMIVVTIGIVSGSAFGVRIFHAAWKQMVFASLGCGASVMLLSRFEFAPFHPGPWANPELIFNPAVFLIGSALFSAPAFLPPLFDPAVRQKGPAPSIWKVALIAFSLSLLFALSAYLSSARRGPGWSEAVGYTLLSGLLLSGLSTGLGLLLALFKRTEAEGASAGGVGILLAIFLLSIWFMLGMDWLP